MPAQGDSDGGFHVLKIEVSYRGIIAGVLALVTLFALVRLWPVVLLVITAFIFMAALLPYVEWLVRRGVPRTAAVLLILVVILGIVAGLFALVVPAMIDEFQSIRDNLPDDARRLEDFLSNFGIKVELQDRARNVNWTDLISGRAAIDYGQRIFQTTISIITIIVLTVYLLVETPRLTRFFYQFISVDRQPEARKILGSLERVVGGYIRGQVITSLAIAVFTLIVLLILGVPNALAFAVLAGFADIIPLVGALIAVVPPTVAAFQESPTQALIVLGLLTAYQQFEDRFFVPRVYGSTLNLPPLIVLIAVLAGGELFGIPGVLLSLPAAAVGRVFLDYVIENRIGGIEVNPTDEVMAPDRPAAAPEPRSEA
jgi:predicted PurR-regulated permease PerM